jgi:hypothetical protein
MRARFAQLAFVVLCSPAASADFFTIQALKTVARVNHPAYLAYVSGIVDAGIRSKSLCPSSFSYDAVANAVLADIQNLPDENIGPAAAFVMNALWQHFKCKGKFAVPN